MQSTLTLGDILHWLLQLVPGIVTSLIVAFITWSFFVIRERWALHWMEGLWLEVIEDEGRPRSYSLGTLRFSFWLKRHRYGGFNYSSTTGEHLFRWDSVRAYFDKDHMNFLYLYEVINLSDQHTNHGFGLIQLPHSGKAAGAAEMDGYFMDEAKVLQNEKWRHKVRFVRADVVAVKMDFLLKPKDEESKKKFILEVVRRGGPPI
jgi:hypothetical protein